jgi:hypothetical protein
MMRALLSVFSTGSVILLASCEGTTTQEWKVRNASRAAIQVTPAFHVVDMQVGTTTVQSGEEVLIATSDEGRGARPDAETHIGNVERILITTDTDTAARNGTQLSDWSSSSERKRRIPGHWDHVHVLTVTDADFD